MNTLRTKVKKTIALIITLMMVLAIIPFNAIPAYATNEVVTDIYVDFNEAGFTKYQIGQIEKSASDQFRTLISVNEEDQSKYEFNIDNTGLIYYIPEHNSWQSVFHSPNPIIEGRDYHLQYTIAPKTGYAFSNNIGDMKLYINGVKAELKYSDFVGVNQWQCFVDIGDPAPQAPITLIDSVNINTVTEPEDGEEAESPIYPNEMFTISACNWTSTDDPDFDYEDENKRTFREEKTYSIELELTPSAGYEFKADTENPAAFDGTAQINGNPAIATLDDGKLTLTYTFPKLPKTVTEIYLTLDNNKLTAFKVGKAEKDVNPQFRTLVKVKEEDQTKYYFDSSNNSGLIYYIPEHNSWVNTEGSTNQISFGKMYHFNYVVTPREGYGFPSNPARMNFYINGVKVNPSYQQMVGNDNSWRIYVPAVPQPSVKVKLYGHDDIQATWGTRSAEGLKYKVEYKRSTWSKYDEISSGTTRTYSRKANLADGARYRFKITPYFEKDGVRYEGKAGYSPYIYTLKKIAAPRVSKSSRNYVRLRWTNIPGESGYEIARSRYKTKGFTTVKRVSYKYSTTTAKTIRNRTYYYKIRAYKTVDGKRIYAPWSAVRAYRLR